MINKNEEKTKQDKTRVDKFLNNLKNHKWTSLIIIIGIILVSISGVVKNVSEAIKSVVDLLGNKTPQKIVITPTVHPSVTITPNIPLRSTPTAIITTLPEPTEQPKPTQQPTRSDIKQTYYDVILVLPSRMSNAEILVDEQPANILEQSPTVVTVRVNTTPDSHQFIIKKGGAICKTQQVISKNLIKVYPCQ
ncbi:hypothetical protein U14_01929 [Candidatus Moduliflexus flocculans]|uniref:Uncharacterized protein n=1 Tax=Candidatus Moduliflexus flocculans TaxID=1499966 RepID=A0A0S6VT56_9BACT|nr:hypothetical protein U14_01929 [Candidatus Moduliflexus flocculans]